MTTPSDSQERHRRAFRRLLRLYPAWFRKAYEEEMTLLFSERLRRATGWRARTALWWRTLKDATSNAAALRRQDREGGWLRMDGIMQDIRYAVRRLVRTPVFTLGAVVLLAIGIGANTAVFTLVDALILRPPPWSEPERVVHVYQDSDDGEPSSNSFPATRDMAEYDEVFAGVTATSPSSATWEGPDGPEPVATEYTTSTYLSVLGLQTQRGRWFGPEHDLVGGALVAVVSDAAWRTRLGADPDVVGQVIRLNGQPVTIIGVGPERLTSTINPLRTDFWLSISSTPVSGPFQVANLERREDHWYQALARLRPGVTLTQAQAAMNALAQRLAEEYPELNRGRDITVYASRDVRMHPQGDAELRFAGGLLAAVALTVLLVACANLASLLLVRGLGRSGEMAVRSALGAPKGRVARLFLIESVLLAATGGLAGLALARWALTVLPALPTGDLLGGTLEVALDTRVILFALSLALGTGLLFGLAPALRSSRADVSRTLRDDRRGTTSDRGTLRLRGFLVAVQVAASLLLVLGTGLMTRSLAALQAVDSGVDEGRIAYMRLDWSRAALTTEQAREAIGELTARVEALPGVERAAMSSRLPAMRQGTTSTEVEGYTPPAGTDAVELPFAIVTDGYFDAMGISLRAGRSFGPDDVLGPAGTSVLVSEAAARRFWGDADPVGRRMRGQGSQTWTRTVVGVVGDVPVAGLGESPAPLFYFSTRQSAGGTTYLIARASGDPAGLLVGLRREIERWLPSVTVVAQGTLEAHFGASLATPRLAARAMGGFSLLALFLAGLGIYTVVSFSVARRSSELGIRIALGAERSRVVRVVVGEVATVVGAGLGVGVLLAALGASWIEGVLFGVEPLDPLTFTGSVLVLLGVAWLAAWLPARRAASVDPVEALRAS
ncbi:MAG TPA: ABC transporter permease [Longimicrobiales bacterium]|nr:ABC transporter permease [Longimicrobiales bacterium]